MGMMLRRHSEGRPTVQVTRPAQNLTREAHDAEMFALSQEFEQKMSKMRTDFEASKDTGVAKYLEACIAYQGKEIAVLEANVVELGHALKASQEETAALEELLLEDRPTPKSKGSKKNR